MMANLMSKQNPTLGGHGEYLRAKRWGFGQPWKWWPNPTLKVLFPSNTDSKKWLIKILRKLHGLAQNKRCRSTILSYGRIRKVLILNISSKPSFFIMVASKFGNLHPWPSLGPSHACCHLHAWPCSNACPSHPCLVHHS